MCGRYALYTTNEINDRYGVKGSGALRASYNVAPSQMMPVVTSDGLHLMRWGLIPPWAKDERIGYRLINARSETVFDKPVWKKPIMQRRCLIPANGFYEWQQRNDGKHPYFVHLKDEQLFSFAGIWETWRHEGKVWETYSILTTTPNKDMDAIHDRMPVILHRDDEAQWLAADNEQDIAVLLRPYSDGKIEAYEVGVEVNTVRVNDEGLMRPIE